MDVHRYIEEIDSAARRMVEVLERLPLNTHVPTCPAWVIRDLVHHQGGIHRWATRIVADQRTDRHWMDLDDLGGVPPDEVLFDWFAEGARALTRALADAPDDLDCWTFIEASSPRVHWARRQAHETAIHRLDAEVLAHAQTPHAVDLAADGVDEYLMAFLYRPRRGPRADVATSLAFAPTDTPERWTITFDAESYSSSREQSAADAIVRGAVSDIYAWVWNRPVHGRVEIDGDPAAAGRYQANG